MLMISLMNTHVLSANLYRTFKPMTGGACTMIFHPSDPDFLFLVGDSDVRLVALATQATVKIFPVQHDMTCETDAVAVDPSGQLFYVATNFSRRVICFAAQGGAHIMWDVSTFNVELEDDEVAEHAVQSLSYVTHQRDQGNRSYMFFAGLFRILLILHLSFS